MATPTNLSEYYSSQGQALPSLQERSSLYAQAGLGTAQQYLAAGSNNATQNTQLLGYLQGQGNQAQGTPAIQGNGAVSIPSDVATGNVQPTPLPNQPTPAAPADVYSSANAYLNTLPQTGVAGLDQTLSAMQNRPGQLAQQYDISNKLTTSNAAKAKLDTFNEQYRVEEERVRTNGALGAEVANARINELERKRAFTAGTYAIESAAANADYQGALSLMNQQAALELEPLKMRYDFFKDMYNRTEDQKFQKEMKRADQEYQTQRDDKALLNDIKLQAFKDGKIDLNQMGSIKSWDDLSNLTGSTKEDALMNQIATDGVKKIESILGYSLGKDYAVGAGFLDRGVRNPFMKNKTREFVADTEAILGNLTIDKLLQAKASGATFGALSEGEMHLLEAAASPLNNPALKIKDRDGNTIGYKVSEEKFNEIMNGIKKYAIIDYEKRTGRTWELTQSDYSTMSYEDLITIDNGALIPTTQFYGNI
jgi:hypothetical protein